MTDILMTPRRSFFGEDALESAKIFWPLFGKKVLIVTGKHVAKSLMMEKLIRALKEVKISWIIFDGITGEPTDQMIAEGVALYQREKCDFCIGIGGGSPLDSAKAISAMSVLSGEISDYDGKEISGTFPPVVAIPTTAGTGSEATKFTIITDTKRDIKMLLKGDVLLPDMAVVDPAFSWTMPKTVTASTGLDALTHAVEAYTSRKAGAITDVLALSAIERIFRFLPRVFLDGTDKEARREMALAAWEAGVCINNSSVTLVHGMSRPVGAMFHVPHGMSNAMLLKACLSFALDGAYERFGKIGREIGAADDEDSDQKAAEKMLIKLEDLCRTCQVPSLEDYGIKREIFMENIDKMSRDALDSGSPANTRKEISFDDVRGIYRKLWEK
ncbi:MAG: iron-containing alcohol dehydrogenase [Ruminococcus sp.]|jgi:alcohol dehydrogenase class IV